MKKILFIISLFGLALVAVPALAAQYAPSTTQTGTNAAGTMMPSPTWVSNQMGGGSGLMGNGNMMYQTMQPGMERSTAMPAVMMATAYGGRLGVWYGIMSIITIILVWIVLIMFIAIMWHWLKKHKHS